MCVLWSELVHLWTAHGTILIPSTPAQGCPWDFKLKAKVSRLTRGHAAPVIQGYGYESIPMDTVRGWTSINPSYFDVHPIWLKTALFLQLLKSSPMLASHQLPMCSQADTQILVTDKAWRIEAVQILQGKFHKISTCLWFRHRNAFQRCILHSSGSHTNTKDAWGRTALYIYIYWLVVCNILYFP